MPKSFFKKLPFVQGYKCVIILLFFLFFLSSFVYAVNITTDLEDNRLYLGEVDEGEVLTGSFLVVNNGRLPVRISVEVLGCSCLDVISPKGKVEISPEDSRKIIFNFNASGLDGKVSKPLYIYTNEKGNSVIKLEISVDVAVKSETFIRRFLNFSSLTVLTAGLIDGINPCAFTVMVFFISFLTFAGYRKKDMVIVGGSFILATYITYILIGLGLFKAVRSLDFFTYFSRIFYFIAAGFAFILAAVNIYDFWIYKKTKNTEKLLIKLPFSIKRRIQNTIRRELIKDKEENKSLFPLIVAGLSCGFIISIKELFCTGQLYLPTIAYILKVQQLKLRAILYLLLYNFMFIVPLIGVFVLTFFGFTSSGFEKIARTHLGGVKLATAFVFFGLGVVLLIFKG